MINEAINLLSNYGWAALFLAVAATLLIRYVSGKLKIWNDRDKERTQSSENNPYDELSNHQFFTNLAYKLDSEIHTLNFNGNQTPIRQKLFRRLLELKLESLKKVIYTIIETDMDNMTPTQWANFVQAELAKGEKYLEEIALNDGMPIILISKFMVWQNNTIELLNGYINDLAISTVYSTNMARTNTLLYLMNLKLITIIGDAERTLIDLNGEISGQLYKGDEIE